MLVFRVDKSRDYTILSNNIFKDHTLSAKAKGLLAEMLSLPENWDYTLIGLSHLFSDGVDSIRQGIRELEEHGYVVRERKRDAKGRLGEMEYVIYETPHKAFSSENTDDKPVCASPTEDSPVLDFPIQDKPIEEKSTQLNTNISKTNLSITYESNPNLSIIEAARTFEASEPQLIDVMGYEEVREAVRENIEYDIMCERYLKNAWTKLDLVKPIV